MFFIIETSKTYKNVQSRLGHWDIQTTMNIYTHVSPEKRDETAVNFANYLAMSWPESKPESKQKNVARTLYNRWYNSVFATYMISPNGDGGSRTRVQTHRHLKIYVHSQLI